jgi:integrase
LATFSKTSYRSSTAAELTAKACFRKPGAAYLSEATIARHLRGLRVVTRWANREGLLPVLPKFAMPPRAKGSKTMRGRAMTGEEFDRMIKVVAKVVENTAAKSWEFYLNGLWTSGLRLSESLTLRWDDAPGAIVVDLSGRHPMFRIPAEAEKGNQDRLLPMTPDFAELLSTVLECDRAGCSDCSIPMARY